MDGCNGRAGQLFQSIQHPLAGANHFIGLVGGRHARKFLNVRTGNETTLLG